MLRAVSAFWRLRQNERVNLGIERAKALARALRCHPAVLVFPGWDVESEHTA
ncbi:hypothetical protein GPUN_1971 [Glaciecola punicea ACAM 611]|uniref:Uncharacterized protein n=1 Tax=Glaciecola punicea ACAM 611 TaxID=1121923 RepID=H5TCQ9_9ALTE|nr:hypothetical protein GPUN_1971 [Glaciecola punicea ACAM 611]